MTTASKETLKAAESAFLTGVQSKCQRLPSQLSVCGAPCPLCFQFEKHAYFHLGPAALVNVNQVGLSDQSIQTWERIHSAHPRDSSMTRVYYTRANVWGKLLWIANQKLQTCLLCKLCVVLKHTWECYYWTNQALTAQLANPWKYMLCLKKKRSDILDLKHDPYGSLFPPLEKIIIIICFCHSKENPIYNLKFHIIRLLSQNFKWGMLRFWLTDSSFW